MSDFDYPKGWNSRGSGYCYYPKDTYVLVDYTVDISSGDFDGIVLLIYPNIHTTCPAFELTFTDAEVINMSKVNLLSLEVETGVNWEILKEGFELFASSYL